MIQLNWSEAKTIIDSQQCQIKYVEQSSKYLIYLFDQLPFAQVVVFKNSSDGDDFESNYKINTKNTLQSELNAFASKRVAGNKLFKRVHGVETVLVGSPQNIDFVVPYDNCKITGVEILNGELGDKVDLLVHDTPTGTISGFPDVQLNQFGFGVFIDQGFHREVSNYDADLIKDMKVRVRFHSSSLKTVYVNLILHEVK